MEELNFYNNLLATLHLADQHAAEYLDEEINILIHKLKFIPQEQRPSVLVVEQKTGFQPIFNEQLQDVVTISGGRLLQEKFDNPSILLIIQENEALYGEIPVLLEDEILSRGSAIQSNQIYIVQKNSFGSQSSDFLTEVEICAEIVQPKYFIYGRQGNEWVKFDLT
ncbi:ABC transporter substrate-binding protein [Sphingobacterium sp. LRF_L2]|uniref:ABC transporter substrate-binding protein n=1 Tax=Sphingobacterium sp. LRF_L2 TaxID=3369421 RepID=UPI003F63046D